MSKFQYYRNGVEISEAEATDHRGLLRDQTSMRVGLTMRDATPSLWAGAPTGAGSNGQRGDQPGDLCTLDGRPGRLKQVGGELRCVPDTRDSVGFTDHSGDPWSASRPGFRLRIGDTRKAQRDAIAEYERELTNRWRCGDQERSCPECDGTGELNGEDCEVCNGSGTLPAGGYDRSADTAMPTPPPARVTDAAQHRKIMDQLYRDYDRTISEQWRQR